MFAVKPEVITGNNATARSISVTFSRVQLLAAVSRTEQDLEIFQYAVYPLFYRCLRKPRICLQVHCAKCFEQGNLLRSFIKCIQCFTLFSVGPVYLGHPIRLALPVKGLKPDGNPIETDHKGVFILQWQAAGLKVLGAAYNGRGRQLN